MRAHRSKHLITVHVIANAVAAVAGFTGFARHADGTTFLATWKDVATGNYSQPGNWSTGVAPNDVGNAFYNVVINPAAGAAVNGNLSAEILNLTVGSGNSLSFAPATQFSLIGAQGGGPTTLSNDGSITLNSSTLSSITRVDFTGGDAFITGAGTIFMTTRSAIFQSSNHLTSSNFIKGGGQISVNQLNNNGTISAEDASLSIATTGGSGVVNNGLLTVTTPTGNLLLSSLFTNNGSITAEGGGQVQLAGASIFGGLLNTSTGGQIRVGTFGVATLGNLTNNGEIRLFNSSTLNLSGTIVNNGSIGMSLPAAAATNINVAGTVTLNGTGTLQLGTDINGTTSVGGSGTLVNNSNIIGHGTFGFINLRNNGLIQSQAGSGSIFITGNLFAPAVVNTGTIEAFAGKVALGFGSWDNTGGTLQVDVDSDMSFGMGTTITSMTITGGSLNVATGADLEQIASSGNTTLSGVAINNAGNIGVQPNTSLTVLNGSLINSGVLDLNNGTLNVNLNGAVNNSGEVFIGSGAVTGGTLSIGSSSVAFAGSGSLQMAGSGLAVVTGSGGTLINGATHSIFGQGSISGIALINNGFVLSSAANPLVLNPTSLVNNGSLNAGNLHTLKILNTSGSGTYTNAGTISAQTTGAVVLGNAVNISGGTYSGFANTAQMVLDPSAAVQISNATFSNLNVNVVATSSLTLGGTIFNTGSINVIAGATFARLLVGSGSVALNGAGTTSLSTTGAGTAVIDGNGGTLNIGSQQLVHGAGVIGSASLAVINNGTISADVGGQTLTINVGTPGFINNGRLQNAGSPAGRLVINNVGGGVIDNTNGNIGPAGALDVLLKNGITINGGTLGTIPSPAGVVVSATTATLNGPMTINAGLVVNGEGTVNFSGLINNAILLQLCSGSSGATLSVQSGSVTIGGTGNFLTGVGGGAATITGAGGTLILGSSQKVRGSGTLGNNAIALTNTGTITAIGDPGQSMTINPSGGNFSNTGTLIANAITLNIVNNFSIGTFSNTGTMIAQSGGTIAISGIGPMDSDNGTIIVQSGGTFLNTTILKVNGVQLDGQFTNLFRVTGPNIADAAISGAGSYTNGDATHTAAQTSASVMHVGTLVINAGTVTLAFNGGTVGTGRVNSLTIAPAAVLDLANDNFVVDYTGVSPLPTIAAQIASGYANGSWNGTGIKSFIAAAIDANPGITHKVGLGYGEASTLGITGTFSGQSIDSTTVLIKYTFVGDANLDSKVNALDFNALATNFGGGGGVKRWFDGDFNYDGVVNTVDFTLLATNFDFQMLPSPPLGALLPEPDSLAATAIAILAFRRRAGRGRATI